MSVLWVAHAALTRDSGSVWTCLKPRRTLRVQVMNVEEAEALVGALRKRSQEEHWKTKRISGRVAYWEHTILLCTPLCQNCRQLPDIFKRQTFSATVWHWEFHGIPQFSQTLKTSKCQAPGPVLRVLHELVVRPWQRTHCNLLLGKAPYLTSP